MASGGRRIWDEHQGCLGSLEDPGPIRSLSIFPLVTRRSLGCVPRSSPSTETVHGVAGVTRAAPRALWGGAPGRGPLGPGASVRQGDGQGYKQLLATRTLPSLCLRSDPAQARLPAGHRLPPSGRRRRPVTGGLARSAVPAVCQRLWSPAVSLALGCTRSLKTETRPATCGSTRGPSMAGLLPSPAPASRGRAGAVRHGGGRSAGTS